MGTTYRQLIILLALVSVASAQYTDFGAVRLFNSGRINGDSLSLIDRFYGGRFYAFGNRDSYGSSFSIGMIGTGDAYNYAGVGFVDSVSGKSWTIGYRTGKALPTQKRWLDIEYYNGIAYTVYANWDSIGNYFVLHGIKAGDSIYTASADSWIGAESAGQTPRLAFVKQSGFGPQLRFLSSSPSTFTVRRVTGGTLLAPTSYVDDMIIGATGNVAFSANLTAGRTSDSASTSTIYGALTINNATTASTVRINTIYNNDPLTLTSYAPSTAYSGAIIGERYLGSTTSPSAVTSGTVITGLYGKAYNGTSMSVNIAAMRILAAGNQTTTSAPVYFDWALTGVNEVSRTQQMSLDRVNGRPRLSLGASAGVGAGKLYIDSLYIGTTLTIDADRNLFATTAKFSSLSDIALKPNLHIGSDGQLRRATDTTSSGGAMTKEQILDTLNNVGTSRDIVRGTDRYMIFQEEFLGKERSLSINVAAAMAAGTQIGNNPWLGTGFRTGTTPAQTSRSSQVGNETTPTGLDTSAFGIFYIDPDTTKPSTAKGIMWFVGSNNATSSTNVPFKDGMVFRTRLKFDVNTDSIGMFTGMAVPQAFATASVNTWRRIGFEYGTAGVGALDSLYGVVSDGTTMRRFGVAKVAASTWYSLEWRRNGANIDFYADDVKKFTLGTNVPAQTTGGAIQLQAWSFDFNTPLGNNKRINWDYVEVSRITPQRR